MKEQLLLDYFQNKASIELLIDDLKDSQQKTGYDTTTVYVTPIEGEGSFFVTKTHLLQLCNEAIIGKLSFENLNTIAFAVITSDFFETDENDEIINRVLFEWDNPEIGFALTIDNMKKWKELLESGMDSFNIKELKQKKKNSK
jgi:hypothetical protein